MNPAKRIVLLSSAFSPSKLFRAGEAGAWYDPSDLSSMYQESTGVTAAVVGQPVGLILDKRLGAALGSELVADPGFDTGTGWTLSAGAAISGGSLSLTTSSATDATASTPMTTVVGNWYCLTVDFTAYEVASALVRVGTAPGTGGNASHSAIVPAGSRTIFFVATATTTYLTLYNYKDTASVVTISGVSVKSIAGNHAIQGTAAARFTLKDPSPYYELSDGVDDNILATFAAGTLTSNMDYMRAIKRNAATGLVAGFRAAASANYFGSMTSSGAGSTSALSGTPTVWVDGVQITDTEGALHTAMTNGAWHILELRGLDLSAYVSLGYGYFSAGYPGSASFGEQILRTSMTDSERSKARRYLARKYGVSVA